jgi:uncharacterized DUF497 family protein
MIDDRFAYGEVRNVAFGSSMAGSLRAFYAARDAERRVISLRKANSER